MADQRDLLVRILGDDRSLQAAFTRTERRAVQFETRTSKIGRGLNSAFAAAGVAVGTAAVFAGISKSIDAASDLNEEMSKSRQIFGDSARAIDDWSRTTANAIGVARVEALQATGVFGNLFSTVGLGQEDAREMSQALVELAADLASFNNADVSDVLNALRSGLIGEAEPLRRYGVLLSEARVQQQAMAVTGKQNVRELTNQEKAMARFNIIMQDTVSAQGDFARTSEGAANQAKVMRANFADLSAELGGNLLPVLNETIGGINSLFDAFDAFNSGGGGTIKINVEDADLRSLAEARDRIAEMKGESNLLVQALDQVIDRLRAVGAARPDDAAGPRGPGAITASNAAVDARRQQDELRDQQRELEKARRDFEEFIKGLGLKLDRAGLTQDLNDDLAVLREIERAIQRRIQAEGRTFKLVQQLTNVQLQIAATVERQQAEAQRKQDDAIARAEEQQRRAAEDRRDRIERARDERERKQFGALGLDADGSERTPSVGSLKKRLGSIRKAVEGTILDTKQTENQLDRIAAVLSGRFGKVGEEVRQAILGMFEDIAGALDEGGKKVGPITKTSGLNTKQILAGLGLSEAEIRELRGRLSGFNASGQGLPGNRVTGGGPNTREGFFVESHVTVNIDGQKVATAVTKQQQKAKKRNPQQKRGPNRNR